MDGKILDLDRNAPLIVGRSQWQGDERIDVRTHYYPEGSDEPKPTKKGVSMKIDKVLVVVQGILEAYAEATGTEYELTLVE